MGRAGGVPASVPALVESVLSRRSLRLVGIYSHLATADSEEAAPSQRQLAVFREVLTRLSDVLPRGTVRHLANSAATLSLPDARFDMIRPGLVLYGYAPAEHLADRVDLKPILRLVSHLTAVKSIPAGHCVGYGATFTTRRPTRLGIVPVGYYDGYLRVLSNEAVVGTAVGDAPVIGRISMDQLAVDLTDLPRLGVGTEVVLIDDTPDRPNSVAGLAQRIGTIPYEVTCLLGQRVQRVAVGRSCASRPSRTLITKPQLQ
jgi:alanine racemase